LFCIPLTTPYVREDCHGLQK